MKNYENKIRRRALFEIFLEQKVSNYIYNIKFKFNFLKLKILSVNEKLENKIIFGKFFFSKFTLFLFKKNNLSFKKILHFLCSNKLNIAPFNNFNFSFNLLLKTKFLNLIDLNNYYLKNEETEKKKKFKQKNEVFSKINSVKIQISTIKNCISFYQVNYNVKFSYFLLPNFYYFVNSIYSKNSLCKILFMKKLILDKIVQINPEYFQIIISWTTVKKLLNDFQCLFWKNFIFFTVKEMYLLILNEYYWFKKKKQRKVFLLSFFIFIVYNSNLLEFVFQKITINRKNSYFFYQNLEIFFEIIKYIKHFSILINFILEDILKNYQFTYSGFNLKYYFYIVIDSIFSKKLIFLIFFFSEKISRHLNNERFVKFNVLDKFFYKFFRLFAICRFNQNSVAINKFVVLLFELAFKHNCIYLNLFFVNQVYKLFMKKQTNRSQKEEDKNYWLLNLKICELICSLDEYKLPFQLNKFLYNILLKKIFLEYFKNLKKKLTLPILIKSIELFNFKTFKLLKFEAFLLRTNINFHCFKINDIEKKKVLLKKTIIQTLKFIFILHVINIIAQNYKTNFFFRFLLNRKSFEYFKKNYHLKIMEHLCIRLILILIEKENNSSIIFFISMKLKFVPLNLLINFYEKKYFLYYIFIYNFSKKFSCNKNEISWIEIIRGKLYYIMIKKELCIKFLKKRIFLNFKNNFYSIFAFFYCFINFYFLQKNKIKFYLISTTYFFRIFILVLLGNLSNFLPQFSTGYILIRIQKKCKIFLQKFDFFINLNFERAFLNEKTKKKWNFYIKNFEKTYILFFRMFYFKNNLLIRSFSLSKWESNFINLINTYNQYNKNLIFKKYLNKIKEISKFTSKYIMFVIYVFVINQFEFDKSIIDHILSDRKSNFISPKLKKVGLKIKTNLSTIRKPSPFTFFYSIQTRIFSTS